MADLFQPKFVDLVRNYTTTSGTEDFVLGPAVNGFASFVDACAEGDAFYYSAMGIDNPADTEVGRGALLAGGVIGRDPIGGKKTNFKNGTTSIALVAAAEWYSAVDAARTGAGPLNVTSFGAAGDGSTDDTAAIQAALDQLGTSGGGALYFPEGTYFVSSCLTVHPRTSIRGAGRQSSKIVSAHSGGGGASASESLRNGSGLATISPVNNSTAVHVLIEDIGIENSNPDNVGAAYYDTGGTYIAARNVAFGGFKYGVVLEQSELVDFDLCEFGGQADGGAGVWIVNSEELTPGASAGYCNRIAIKRSQFNQSGGAYGVLDDGGYAHVLEDNNYNGCINHVRAAGVGSLIIDGGEFESAASHCILLANVTLSGAAVGGSATAIRGGLYNATAGNASIQGEGAPGSLHVDGVPVFAGGAGACPISGAQSFAGLWLLSYTNNSAASLIKDGNGQWVDVDGNRPDGFSINGVACQNGIVTASNIGSAAARSAGDFLQPANNLSDVASVLDAAKNLGSGTVLAQSAVPVSHSGDTAEVTLATVTIPADAMGANGRLYIREYIALAGTAASKTIRVKFGDTTIAIATPSSQVTAHGLEIEIGNRGSADSQFGFSWGARNDVPVTASSVTATVDTSQDALLTITGQVANASDSISLESLQVILYPKA